VSPHVSPLPSFSAADSIIDRQTDRSIEGEGGGGGGKIERERERERGREGGREGEGQREACAQNRDMPPAHTRETFNTPSTHHDFFDSITIYIGNYYLPLVTYLRRV
jgi:hypothetical protein